DVSNAFAAAGETKARKGEESGKRLAISSAELAGVTGLDRWHEARRGGAAATPMPTRLLYPTDAAFADITAVGPALVPGAADAWRERLTAAAGPAASFPIDDAAKQLLAAARKRLAPGVYRWDDRELAVDAHKRFAWRRTTEHGLDETASFDGTTLMRR